MIEFTYVKRKFKGYFQGYGTVKETDKGHILFVDNDNYQHRVNLDCVKYFEVHESPVKKTMMQKVVDFFKQIITNSPIQEYLNSGLKINK